MYWIFGFCFGFELGTGKTIECFVPSTGKKLGERKAYTPDEVKNVIKVCGCLPAFSLSFFF
jgi:hypothetical protein